MDTRQMLEQVKNGTISIEEAESYFRKQPFLEMGFAKLDAHRQIRSGYPEVVFCSGKEDAHLLQIMEALYQEQGEVLGTRASEKQYALVKEKLEQVEYDPVSRILKLEKPDKKRIGSIAVCTAGTADIPVAEEAAQTAEFFGNRVERIYDVGVSGLHRLLANLEVIQQANCVIAVAGMEGALASVLGGLVDKPVIAVPTSVGYGASMKGLSALLTMINSCANGVATVNIDNGYGAGYLASQINRMAKSSKEDAIKKQLRELTKRDTAVAFSGGADSALLLKLTKELAAENGTKVIAMMAKTQLQEEAEVEEARALAQEIGTPLHLVEIDLLTDEDIAANPVNRCYLCKKKLFTHMLQEAKGMGIDCLLEGTNADDLLVYRPGRRALEELGIISPFALHGLSKSEVRAWLTRLKISVAKKPAAPCLATRIPYGQPLHMETLEKLGKGERYCKQLGITQVRFRLHGELLRIEIPLAQIPLFMEQREEIVALCKQLGFVYITLDIEGFRSGSMDFMQNASSKVE